MAQDAGKFPGSNTNNGKNWSLALKQSAKMIVLH